MTQQQQQRKVALQARVEQVRRDLEAAIAQVQEEQLQQHSFRALRARETTTPASEAGE